jgi:hypothetical protein
MKNEGSPPAEMRSAGAMIAHKRQMRLEVYLPLGLSILAIGALVAWLWLGGVGDAGTWADVALIALIIPALFAGLIVLATVIALAVLIGKLTGLIPEPASQVQKLFHRAERGISRGADQALQPFLILSAIWAAVRAIGRGLAGILGIK